MGRNAAPDRRAGRRALFRGVRGRLFGSYVALVFVLLAGISTAFSSAQVLRAHFTHTVNTVDALAGAETQAMALLDDEEASLRGYLLSGDNAFLQPYAAARRAVPALLARAEQILDGDAHGRGLLAVMQQDEQAWQAWATPYVQSPPAQARRATQGIADLLRERALFARLRQSAGRLTAYLATERARDLQSSLTAMDRQGGVLFWVLIVTTGMVAVVGWLTTRGITRALDRLAGAATAIGHGALDRPVAVSGPTELARLGASMDQMRRQLHSQRAMTEILASSLQLESVWARFAAGMRELVPFDDLRLSACDGDGALITTLYAEEHGSEHTDGATARALGMTARGVLDPAHRCLVIPDLAALPDEQRRDMQGELQDGLRALALVPLRANGQVRGILQLASTHAGAFTDDALGPVLALAPLVGAAMENARLYRSLDEVNGALARANRELEAFSSSVSHDLRAPLRSIVGFSQAVLEDYAERLDDEGRVYLRQVIDAGNDMAQLIDDLLRLARLTRVEMQREQVDVSTLARGIVEQLAQGEPTRAVTVSIADGLVARGDRRLLRVMLENLLGNAWKFTRHTAAPRIEVGAIPHEGGEAFFVRDNGAGFDMAYAGKLFGAFQRLHSAGEFEGTGIGLATVQRIVHRHGGRVWAEGAVGHGATFYFTLA